MNLNFKKRLWQKLRSRFELSHGNILQRFHGSHPWLFWGVVFSVNFIILAILFYLYIAFLLPLPKVFYQPQTSATTKIFDRNGELLYEIFQPDEGKKTLIKLSQIPDYFVKATLAAEDIHFYEHGGVDPWAIVRAVIFNVREQRIVSGASTIPQQLVRKMLGIEANRDLSDKILEAFYAVRLSHLYDKDQILELYLNKIYYGNLAYGSEAAALDYFDKHLIDLDLAQSAFLAGLPQSPTSYNPFLYFDRAKKKQQYVLDQMAKYNFISSAERDGAFAEPLHLRHNIVEMKAPHFVQYVMNQLDNQLGSQALLQGGFSVYTTLDYHLQKTAEAIVSRQVSLLKDKHVTNGSLLAIDPKTSQILAWVGSEDYFNKDIDGQVDMVTALRQPGSSLKPFTYLLSFEKGYTPATILDDIPTEFATDQGPYAPKNYDLRYHGPVRARNALASSFNIPAVKTLEYVGLESFIAFLREFGIGTLEQNPQFYGLALTLGGGEIRMLDLARAYNVLANYGSQQELGSILTIQKNLHQDSRPGSQSDVPQKEPTELVYQWQKPPSNFLLGPHGKEHVFEIIDILKDRFARLGGFGEGSVLELSRPAAVKTGTTRNFRDNWTVGFTPNLLTAVWVGNADGSAMFNISGVDGAGPIWHDFMEAALQFAPAEDFKIPSGLKQIEICSISGKLPTKLCPEKVTEWFVQGEEPKTQDDYYQQCDGKTVLVYPSKFQKWAQGEGYSPPPKNCKPVVASVENSSGWAGSDPNSNKGVEKPTLKPLEQIMIDSPQPNDEYILENSLPLKDQKIPFRVTVPLETREVHFFVDGKLVGTLEELPFTYLWLPTRGRHALRVEVIMDHEKTLESSLIYFEIK